MSLLVGDIVRHAARVVPDALAATHLASELTFAQLDEWSNRTARALASLGIAPGERLAWWGETSLDAMPIFTARGEARCAVHAGERAPRS